MEKEIKKILRRFVDYLDDEVDGSLTNGRALVEFLSNPKNLQFEATEVQEEIETQSGLSYNDLQNIKHNEIRLNIHSDQISELMKQMVNMQNEVSLNARALVKQYKLTKGLQSRLKKLEDLKEEPSKENAYFMTNEEREDMRKVIKIEDAYCKNIDDVKGI